MTGWHTRPTRTATTDTGSGSTGIRRAPVTGAVVTGAVETALAAQLNQYRERTAFAQLIAQLRPGT